MAFPTQPNSRLLSSGLTLASYEGESEQSPVLLHYHPNLAHCWMGGTSSERCPDRHVASQFYFCLVWFLNINVERYSMTFCLDQFSSLFFKAHKIPNSGGGGSWLFSRGVSFLGFCRWLLISPLLVQSWLLVWICDPLVWGWTLSPWKTIGLVCWNPSPS